MQVCEGDKDEDKFLTRMPPLTSPSGHIFLGNKGKGEDYVGKPAAGRIQSTTPRPEIDFFPIITAGLYKEPTMIIIFTTGFKPSVIELTMTAHFHRRRKNRW